MMRETRNSTHPHISRAREKLSESVEARCHDPVGSVKGLFDAVSVVHVDVDVEHSRVDAVK
jgi:hypothetical protein